MVPPGLGFRIESYKIGTRMFLTLYISVLHNSAYLLSVGEFWGGHWVAKRIFTFLHICGLSHGIQTTLDVSSGKIAQAS